MIDLNICAKCPRCNEFSPSKVDKDGKIICRPAVDCDVASSPLMGDSELPEGCPYVLEQTLLQDRAFDDFENLKDDEEEDEHTP